MMDTARHLHRLGPAPFTVADFKGRRYSFTLLEIRKEGEDYILTWEALRPHHVKADVMIKAGILEEADAPTLAAMAAECSELDLRDRAFIAEVESK